MFFLSLRDSAHTVVAISWLLGPPKYFSGLKNRGIATPVRGLVRNDIFYAYCESRTKEK